jgi:hypothetical protein
VLRVDAAVADDVRALCGRLHDLLVTTGAEFVTCDVSSLASPSAGDVDALARLQLTALRLGRSIRLRHASSRLCELLDLCGLGEAVPGAARPMPATDTVPLDALGDPDPR